MISPQACSRFGKSDAAAKTCNVRADRTVGCDRLREQRGGIVRDAVLDIVAAFLAADQNKAARAMVDRHGQVDFAFDGHLLLDQHSLGERAGRAGLLGDQTAADQTVRNGGRRFGCGGDPDAAGPEPVAREDLRLHHDRRGGKAARRRLSFLGVHRHRAWRAWDAILLEKLLGLEFVQFHGIAVVCGQARPAARNTDRLN